MRANHQSQISDRVCLRGNGRENDRLHHPTRICRAGERTTGGQDQTGGVRVRGEGGEQHSQERGRKDTV